MTTNVHIKNAQEFEQFKIVARILNQPISKDSFYARGTQDVFINPENNYLNFDTETIHFKNDWMQVSKKYIEENKQTIISFEEFNEQYNPYNDLSIIQKASEHIKGMEDSEYTNGLFNGFIEGYIASKTELK